MSAAVFVSVGAWGVVYAFVRAHEWYLFACVCVCVCVWQEVERILSMPDGLAPDPNDKDSLGRTAMHLAAWAGHGPVVKRLAEAGGDPSATAADNMSCLHFACQKGGAGAVTELLAAKAGVCVCCEEGRGNGEWGGAAASSIVSNRLVVS